MPDYISREAALKFRLTASLRPEKLTVAQAVADAIAEYIQAIPAADVVERPCWTPVTERLPENCADVLAYIERNAWGDEDVPYRKREIAIAYHVNGMWHVDGCSGVDGLAWQPLPEPPKEEARITVTCTKCPCKGACDELPEDMSCEDVLAYYAIEPPEEEA